LHSPDLSDTLTKEYGFLGAKNTFTIWENSQPLLLLIYISAPMSYNSASATASLKSTRMSKIRAGYNTYVITK